MINKRSLLAFSNRKIASAPTHLGWLTVLAIAVTVAVSGCNSKKEKDKKEAVDKEPIVKTAFADAKATGSFTRLTAEQSGIHFQQSIIQDHELRRLYYSGFACGGLAIGDVTGDGLADLFVVDNAGANQLYRNDGDMKFTNITESAGIEDFGRWGGGASMVDIDNDGDLDIYVCNYNEPNELHINDGEGNFTEQAEKFAADFKESSMMGYFSDIDNDGMLDMYLLTSRLYHEKGRPGKIKMLRGAQGIAIAPEWSPYFRIYNEGGDYSLQHRGRPDYLFRFDGQNYQDVTNQSGIGGDGHGQSAVWWDYDSDGDLDMYVCNDFKDPDCLYENQGDGTFKNVIKSTFPHTTWNSMGSDLGDLNNDGRLDFFSLDMASSSHYKSKVSMGNMGSAKYFLDNAEPRQYMRNFLFLGTGTGRFLEAAQMASVDSSDWSWATRMEDFDNDGRVDIFITNGHTRPFHYSDLTAKTDGVIDKTMFDMLIDEPVLKETNKAYRNEGDMTFRPIESNWNLNLNGMSYATATGDLDNDGDLDLIVANLDEPIGVYRNDISDANRVIVALEGEASNSHGIGATIELTSASRTQVSVINPMRGFMSCNEAIAHFGLGADEKIDTLRITWPSGKVQVLKNLDANQRLLIREPAAAGKLDRPDRKTMFTKLDRTALPQHREIPYDDFKDQPLLPNKLSQLGPGVSVGDIDGNGLEDVYVSRARVQPRAVATSTAVTNGTGRTKTWEQRDIGRPGDDSSFEDMASLFFDAEGDGDQDLYVVSGSVESTGKDGSLSDRLYLNDGRGNLAKAGPDVLPTDNISGSIVAAADFDRDGDLDLFVGGRLKPGEYPMSPQSRLLRNESEKDSPKFTVVTEELAPEVQECGMVTGAIWSDANNDGWIDLLVTTEWGPIQIFFNDSGRLVRGKETGLESHLGWWNGIAGRDIDNDGDIDYVATNFGLNTKYHPTTNHPTRIYYGTFGATEEPRIIEAKVGDDQLLPVRGKSCSETAMPFISEKFDNFHEFASATLEDIYTPGELGQSTMFEVNHLESSILRNDGTGKFTVEPLPRIAQIAPSFGIVLSELNGDGLTDAYLVQNFYTAQRETGRMAGGISQLLLGTSDGGFKPVEATVSGLVVPSDAKGVAIADINDDNAPDLLIGTNNGPTLCFESNHDTGTQMVTVKLRGPEGNPTAVGARVTVKLANGTQQLAEVTAGGGYLSQSTATLFFGSGGNEVAQVLVTWPDGSKSTANGGKFHFNLSTPN